MYLNPACFNATKTVNGHNILILHLGNVINLQVNNVIKKMCIAGNVQIKIPGHCTVFHIPLVTDIIWSHIIASEAR